MFNFFDYDGKISLFALASRPKFSESHPHYLAPDAVSRIAKFRIEQMKREAKTNVAALEASAKKRR